MQQTVYGNGSTLSRVASTAEWICSNALGQPHRNPMSVRETELITCRHATWFLKHVNADGASTVQRDGDVVRQCYILPSRIGLAGPGVVCREGRNG